MKRLFFAMLLVVFSFNTQVVASPGTEPFKTQVERTDCGSLEELYYRHRSDLTSEADIDCLINKINICRDQSRYPNVERMDRLRETVLDRKYAQRYQRARKALPAWLLNYYDEFKN